MANDYYDIEIAGISARVGASGARLHGLVANLNRAINKLAEAQSAGLATEERGVLLAFEEMLVESLNRSAWLLHERGDTGGARECLELVRRVREMVQGVIEG